MVTKIFVVFDKATGVYSQPMFTPHKGGMLRSFSDEVGNPESPYSKHPEHFSLFYIGEFDDCSGGLSPLAQPEFVCSATEFKV